MFSAGYSHTTAGNRLGLRFNIGSSSIVNSTRYGNTDFNDVNGNDNEMSLLWTQVTPSPGSVVVIVEWQSTDAAASVWLATRNLVVMEVLQ